MIILCDMDDTILFWGKYKDQRLRADYPHLTEFLYGELQTTWDLMYGLDEDHARAMIELMDSPGFYAGFEPMPGAVKGLNEMVDEGHDVFIVSTPWATNPTCMQDKYNWLNTHVGLGWGDRLILTRDKTVIDGDILFDDKPEIKGVNHTPRWTQVLVSQPHNASVSGLQRMDDWSTWRTFKTNAEIARLAEQHQRNRLPKLAQGGIVTDVKGLAFV